MWTFSEIILCEKLAYLLIEFARDLREKKTLLLHYFVWFQMHNKRLYVWSLSFFWARNELFLKNYVTSEGALFYNVVHVYCQKYLIARYHVSFYAYNYFQSLPIVSSAFNRC